MQEALELLEILGEFRPVMGGEDTIKWWPSADGCFSVSSCYSLLRDRQLEEVVEAHTMEAINRTWDTAVPSKIKVFGWRFFLNRLPSKDQLERRNIINRVEDKLCVFCSVVNEDLAHMGFLCFFAAKVWDRVAVWLNIRASVWMKKNQIGIIWLATVWSLWNTRNNFIFNNCDIVLDEVVVGIKMVSWIWVSVGATNRVFFPFYSWLQAPLVALKNL
ncbi:uncharacterized protein LOC131657880 [Vicia villosa]|uniref:uncharacterized protein LOC131657880 n=1 Tax=Vicia villosa TaxID=3911 RepID=UPI00273BA16A|nr:uncharacterized protein LOC131657880 [Vicia villosa]